MIRPLIAALTLVLALVAPVAAQTSRVQLTDQAWVDLGAAPFTVRTLGSPAAIVIDTAPPSGLNVPFTVLGSEEQRGLPVTVSGTHAYARALSTSTAVATFPASVASSGSGGGGAATIADGADTAEGARADTAATNSTSSWSVISLLKGLFNGLQVPTVAAGKLVETSVAVSANTSTQLVAANASRIGLEIQCDATAPVGLGRTGATLTSVAASGFVIPSGSYQAYQMPFATLTAVTAYTATAQTCRVSEYTR
jgi:hypothetical protein